MVNSHKISKFKIEKDFIVNLTELRTLMSEKHQTSHQQQLNLISQLGPQIPSKDTSMSVNPND